MKIEAKKLKDFLRKTTLNNKILGGTLKIENNNIMCSLKSGSAVAVESKMSVKANKKEEYNIKNLPFVIKCLDIFDGVLETTLKDNKILLFNKNTEIEMSASDPEYISEWNMEQLPSSLEFPKTAKVDSSIFSKCLTSYNIMKSQKSVEEGTILLKIKDKVLSLRVGSEGFDTIKMKTPIDIEGEIECEFILLLEIMDVLEGEIELRLNKSHYPIQIVRKTPDDIYTFTVAPYTEKSE